MKGLLRKDVYVLFQASRAQLLIVLLFLVISMTMNNTLIAYMLALYAAMMPITVISLDERSRFDRFALALPWSRAQIVVSKYALSLAAACFAALSYLAGVLTLGSAVNGGISLQDALTTFCAMLTIGTLLPALMRPFVFRFGVDKGRMWIMLITIAFGVGAGLLSMDEGSAVSQLANRLTALPLWLLPLAGLTAFALSAFVSVQIYRRREL